MHLDLPGLINTYGYLAVMVGAFLEGETILALAGLAAFHGYLDFYTVVAIALVAGFAGDQFFFFLGRRHGTRILARFPHAQDHALAFDAMLARWHAPLIVAVRFMYGFRIVGPILLGMGRVSSLKFVVYNFVGALIWAPLIASIGYFFGSLVEVVLGDVEDFEIWLFVALAAACAVGVVLGRLRSRRA